VYGAAVGRTDDRSDNSSSIGFPCSFRMTACASLCCRQGRVQIGSTDEYTPAWNAVGRLSMLASLNSPTMRGLASFKSQLEGLSDDQPLPHGRPLAFDNRSWSSVRRQRSAVLLSPNSDDCLIR